MNKEYLINNFEIMKNLVCWSVIGPSHGSIISIGFGNKILRDKPLNNQYLSDVNRLNKAEFELIINCTWRLENKFEILLGSEDAYDDIMQKLILLQDQRIISYQLEAPAFDLKIVFENGCKLNIFCSNTNPDSLDTNYDLYIPNGCISVGCKGAIDFEGTINQIA